jgi:hypothetical protein
MDSNRPDVFAPLHREQPPDAWERVTSAAGEFEASPYVDVAPARSHRPLLVAAAVLLVVGVGAGALLARGGGPDTTTSADGSPSTSSAIAASGPCPFELTVPDVGVFAPVVASTLLPADQVAMVGDVTILRTQHDDQVIEVFAGAFDDETFNRAVTANESGQGGGPGAEINTVVSFTPVSGTCTMWGIYATGLDYSATVEAVDLTVNALSNR